MEISEMATQIYSLHQGHLKIADKLKSFRLLIQEEDIQDCPADDGFILLFLRFKNYDVHLAFKVFRKFWTNRLNYPDLYTDLRISDLEHVYNKQIQDVPKLRDHKGNCFFIFRPGSWNPKLCSWNDVFRANLICFHRIASMVDPQKSGVVAIMDLSNITMDHVRTFTPKYAKNICDMLQGAFPLRFMEIHIVNETWIFNVIFSMVCSFLREKTRQKIHFHGNRWKSLHAHVDPCLLPATYGGSLPEADNSSMVARLKDESYVFDLFQP